MPAVMRGGSAGRGGRGSGGKPSAYAPAKLRGAAGVGLKPHAAMAAAGTILFAGVVLMLATGGRAQALAGFVSHGVDGRLGAMGFRLAAIQVRGADGFAEPDIRARLGLEPGVPILGLDLKDLRARVEGSGWARSATVTRLLPDTLVVTIDQRPRLAVWQSHNVTSVVDPQGFVIPEADAGRFPELPMVVGEGAAQAAAAILPLIASRPSLAAKMEALIRVDQRRWDIRLKDGALIALPATAEDEALIRLDQLDQSSRVLELGFERIDLRDPAATTVRPKTAGTPG